MLRLRHVSKKFEGLPVIDDLSFSVSEHEIVALVGPSGCGKSTALNLIAGTETDYEGTIETYGARIGYVFQEDRVLPWLTVWENLEVVRDDVDEDRIRDLISRMHLEGFEDYYPDQLSGGMRQRCGIARAFYYGSDLLLMDEPFKSLDQMLRMEMLENLVDSWAEERSSVLFVTHDVDEALMIADRILVMRDRPTAVMKEFRLKRGQGLRDLSDPEVLQCRKEVLELLFLRVPTGGNRMKGNDTEKTEGKALGVDLGTSSLKIVLREGGKTVFRFAEVHYGQPLKTLKKGLTAVSELIGPEEKVRLGITGANAGMTEELLCPGYKIDEIPAIIAGVRSLCPEAGSVIEIGSQNARFIADPGSAVPRFSENEHCAGGTGSFFEDQMSRLGMKIEDYSALTEKAVTVPRLSGRCAVFAKTDIIHRQQEGVPKADILLGLCYAMIRNYRATIVKSLPVRKPVAFTGGVTKNSGAVRAVRDVFGLKGDELLIPEDALYSAAAGAAVTAEKTADLRALAERITTEHMKRRVSALPKLSLRPDSVPALVSGTEVPAGQLSLGIDIGSTSTDLVLVDEKGTLIDRQYLRTAGDPELAVRTGLKNIKDRFGELMFHAVGVTGSGRERIGEMIGADAVRDEITAQAKGAVFCDPETDTVFEIGGQDSKYISVQNGEVIDFRMNKICAAGTGSFIEEQASRMGIPIDSFGPMALKAEAPAELGERCTVFIETSIASAVAEGVSEENIAAGLCHAIVKNYLHKVVGGHAVGKHIMLQGGVAFNTGIIAAFQAAYGDRVKVSPYFPVSGAVGAALLAAEAVPEGEYSSFRGFAPKQEKELSEEEKAKAEEIRKNIEFYEKAGKLLLDGYDGKIDPAKKTVGIPFVLMIHKFFPMANAYFKNLGYNVILTEPTNEDTIALSQRLAQGETCYPVKLIYGHMQQLIDRKVDYIFMPSIHTMKHPVSRVAHNYGCVYMQTAPKSIARILGLKEKGITLLNPEFDLDFGQPAMAGAMIGLGEILGKPKPVCLLALKSGAAAVRKHGEQVEKLGAELMAGLKPEDKVLVLITRNYGIGDPVLNMGIPKLLLERGHKVITLSHLPGHDLDISADHPNLYWPFGQHILSGAKIIAHHPNLYAVYLTNHGCGPDSMLSHLFREEMGDKPYLQIEVDEHFSKVGVITRIEAFLNSLSHREAAALPENFDLMAVNIRKTAVTERPNPEKTAVLPDLGYYTEPLKQYLKAQGYASVRSLADDAGAGREAYGNVASEAGEYSGTAQYSGAVDISGGDASLDREKRFLREGKRFTNSKEYVTFTALTGGIVTDLKEAKARGENPGSLQYLVPQNLGSEADGQYARVIKGELEKAGYPEPGIAAPKLELLPGTLGDPDAFFRAVAAGDLIYAAPPERRAELGELLSADRAAESTEIPGKVPSWETLLKLAEQTAEEEAKPLRLTVVGEPMLLTSLNEGVLSRLEAEGIQLCRQPLAEYLWMLWRDQPENSEEILLALQQRMVELSRALGVRSAFSPDPEQLIRTADTELPRFAGAAGRYRFAKIMKPVFGTRAVLHVVPRYENTEMILEMRGAGENCPLPYYNMALDGDWDQAAENRLKSFLYFVK